MPLPTEGEYSFVEKNQDEAIAELVEIVLKEPKAERYSKNVYKTAWRLVEAFKAADAVFNYRLTDLDEYRAEVERRRQIGLTIDPATAETMFWYADINDAYDILDPEKHHEGLVGREQFARHPGGEWVHFRDLPEATCEALWKRDGHKLVWPYDPAYVPGADFINYPPAAQVESEKEA